MCLSHIPDPSSLLWEKGLGEDGINVMPSEAVRLSQILKFFTIRVRVSGERTKAFFYLRQVCKGEGNMDSHDSFGTSHLPERVEGSWLARRSMRVSVWGTHGILWFWIGGRASGRGSGRRSGGRGGRRGGGSSRKSGGRRGRRSNRGSTGGWLLNNGGSCLIRCRLISRVERRESVRVTEGNWGFCSQKDLGRGARGTDRRLRVEVREGLDIGTLLLLSSAFAEIIEIPENVRVKHAIKQSF
jgi:hypothetical protein